jgi:hypothetical protein
MVEKNPTPTPSIAWNKVYGGRKTGCLDDGFAIVINSPPEKPQSEHLLEIVYTSEATKLSERLAFYSAQTGYPIYNSPKAEP